MSHIGQTELPLRLECSGLTIGGHVLPPFQVRAEEAVCLHVEYAPSADHWYDSVQPLLLGRIKHPAIRLLGVVANLERPFSPRRWMFWRKNPSARDWLLTEGKLSPQEAAHVLSQAPVPINVPVGWLGWGERTMLALEACLLHPPDLLVFDTAGCAGPTIEAVFDRLATRPSGLALAYLKTNLNYDYLPCLPGASCHVIAAVASQTAAVE